jgi:hypothetical protein
MAYLVLVNKLALQLWRYWHWSDAETNFKTRRSMGTRPAKT